MAFLNSSHSPSGLDPFGPGSNALISSNRKLLDSGEFSDVTIVCGPKQFQVHQFILCPRSPFFATALQGNFLEGHTKTIELPDDDPTTVHQMLRYLYTLQYSIQEPSSDPNVESEDKGDKSWRSCLQCHCAVYILADKLDIADLKDYSLTQFKTTVRQQDLWNLEDFLDVAKSSLSMLPTSDNRLVPELLRLCAEHIGKHPETLVSMSGGFGVTLEATAFKTIEEQSTIRRRWQDMLKGNPDFTVALLKKIVQQSGDLQRSHDNLEKKYGVLNAENEKRRLQAPRTTHSIFDPSNGPPSTTSIFASINGRPNSTIWGGRVPDS